MWPVAAAVSAGTALAFKLRGDRLSQQCERTLDDLEATEDDLDAVKEELKLLMEQVKAQESTIIEVRRSKVKAEDEALRSAQLAAEHARSASAMKADMETKARKEKEAAEAAAKAEAETAAAAAAKAKAVAAAEAEPTRKTAGTTDKSTAAEKAAAGVTAAASEIVRKTSPSRGGSSKNIASKSSSGAIPSPEHAVAAATMGVAYNPVVRDSRGAGRIKTSTHPLHSQKPPPTDRPPSLVILFQAISPIIQCLNRVV